MFSGRVIFYRSILGTLLMLGNSAHSLDAFEDINDMLFG